MVVIAAERDEWTNRIRNSTGINRPFALYMRYGLISLSSRLHYHANEGLEQRLHFVTVAVVVKPRVLIRQTLLKFYIS